MLRKKTIGKKLIALVKSCLHIAIYIMIGLLLAHFINGVVQAAEPDLIIYNNEESEEVCLCLKL